MLTYYLLVPVLYAIAYLPTGVLYGISRGLAFVLRNIIGYRKQVVNNNIKNAFPNKSESERAAIAKESYQHLADRVVENIKCFTIDEAEINRRMTVKNPEVLERFYKSNRHVVLMVGHIGAWEFGGYRLATLQMHKLFGIVSLVSNPHFNRLIQSTRSKMGMQLIPMKDSKHFFQQPLTETSLGIFISDQSPSNLTTAYWTNFLNQETAFFTGAERYARQHNCVVIYPKIVQVKQGYYSAEFIVIEENINATPENEVTEKFVRLLEAQIKEHPADWLWSHKRWKHKKAPTNIAGA